MKLMLELLAVSALLELVTVLSLRGVVRKCAAALTLILASFASGGIAALDVNVLTAVLLVIGLYRVVNMLRVVEARMNEAYLRRAVRRTAAWLLLSQALLLAAWFGVSKLTIADSVWLNLLIALQLLAAAVLLASTLRHLRTTSLRLGNAAYADRDLPTVTVAVPARNEDEQLEECLQSILASDYPKLEVLVLDDCSQDRTSQIIRGFAHDGVRFIPGDEPKPNWLAKNQAYEHLVREASGDILLFCGVDVYFGPQTVRQLVTTLLQKKKSMLSIMPLYTRHGLSLLQSMRYMWELSPPRRMFNRPPVLGSCWLTTRKELKAAGGFAAVAQAITPEAHFAQAAIKHDGYSFARADAHLGLSSAKNPREQRATAIRTRYPQVHRRPELVLLLSLFELTFLAAPFALVIIGVRGAFGMVPELGLICIVLILLSSYYGVCSAVFAREHWTNVLFFPWAVLSDVFMLNYSMRQYEFSEVVWKDRNICIPVMRAYPRLPKV